MIFFLSLTLSHQLSSLYYQVIPSFSPYCIGQSFPKTGFTNRFQVSQVLGSSVLMSATGSQDSQEQTDSSPSRGVHPPLFFQYADICYHFLFVPWYEKNWEVVETCQLSHFFSPSRSPRIWGLLYSYCKVIISVNPFSALCFSGLDSSFSWNTCFHLSGFTLSFS